MNNITIGIVGVGNVGSTLAFNLATSGLCHTILLKDIREDFIKAMSIDISQAAKASSNKTKVKACLCKDEFENCNIVVITAGIARKPNMSREDLLLTNAKIIQNVFDEILEQNKDAIFIIVSNPLDAMVHVAIEKSKLPRNRVFGMAGALDTSRFKYYIEQKLTNKYDNIEALVIGSHSNKMVPLINHVKIDGKKLTNILKEKDIEEILENTKNGGAKIVELLKTGSAYFAPAHCCFLMCKAIITNSKEVFATSTRLIKEYNYNNLTLGVPCILGKDGIEKIIELELSEEETIDLKNSAKIVEESINLLQGLNNETNI